MCAEILIVVFNAARVYAVYSRCRWLFAVVLALGSVGPSLTIVSRVAGKLYLANCTFASTVQLGGHYPGFMVRR